MTRTPFRGDRSGGAARDPWRPSGGSNGDTYAGHRVNSYSEHETGAYSGYRGGRYDAPYDERDMRLDETASMGRRGRSVDVLDEYDDRGYDDGGYDGYGYGDRRGGGQPPSRGRRRRARVRRRRHGRNILLGLLVAMLLGLIGALAAFAIAYARITPPDPNKLALSNTTTLYYNNGKSVLGSFHAQDRISVPLDQVPKPVQDAFIAAENRTFWTDNGVSPTGIARAAWNQLHGGATQGGSTITQQYVKNYYLDQEQTWRRKVKELFITLKVERQSSKQEILQNYLNTSYFGRGAYGIEVASNNYFGKHVQELTPKEAAVLAALLRAPSHYDPAADPANKARLEGRYHYVLSGMATMGSQGITAADATTAKLPKISPITKRQIYKGPNGYLLTQVRNELMKDGFKEQEIESGGLRVTTTFDPKAQHAMEQAFKNNFPTKNAKGVHAGGAAVRPGTCQVVAMYGGPDYLKRQFNDATQAELQPGSTFKPFALAAALENDISLKSRFAGNSPLELDNGDIVKNEFNRDYGKYVDLMKATRDSINTAYVDMTVNAISPSKVVDAALRAGIPPDTKGLEKHAKVALGFASVTPLDMANSYATFAIGGQRCKRHVVDKVTDRNGAIRYEAAPGLKREFDSDVTRDLNYALQDVVRRGSAEQEAKALGRPAAGKTGTHEDLTAWFVGYTPQLSASVAFYKDANGDGVKESLDNVGGMGTFFGGGYPTRIWTAFMKGALEGQPVQEFPPPAKLGTTINPAPTFTPTPTPTMTKPGPGPKNPKTPRPGPTRTQDPFPWPTKTDTPSPDPSPSPTKTKRWPFP